MLTKLVGRYILVCMTKGGAREILKNSAKLKPWYDEDDGEGKTYYFHLGDFYQEYTNSFSFAVYPYSSEEPIDPTYGFEYFVDKETGEIYGTISPMSDWELARLTPPKIR